MGRDRPGNRVAPRGIIGPLVSTVTRGSHTRTVFVSGDSNSVTGAAPRGTGNVTVPAVGDLGHRNGFDGPAVASVTRGVQVRHLRGRPPCLSSVPTFVRVRMTESIWDWGGSAKFPLFGSGSSPLCRSGFSPLTSGWSHCPP